MKKLLLLLLFLVPISVNADENIEKVFKIESYVLNELTNSYGLVQYGSAVYVEDGLIYTNAHVVLDQDNEPIGNYRVCKTIDFRKVPICFSVGKLLYYDVKNDLAVLEIVSKGLVPITKSSKGLEIGDTVKVYGYPSNGGETITYTEGKISGFEDGLYKVDANIDAGNSGGGVFDGDGNLIGMAVSVKVGYTTLGYIIPTGKINDFKNKINKNNIKDYDNKVNSKFLLYNLLLKKTLGSNEFINNEVEISGFTRYGFSINYYNIDNNGKFYLLGLTDKNKETSVIVSNITLLGESKVDTDTLYKDMKKDYAEVKESGDLKLYKVRKLELEGRETVLTFTQSEDESVMLLLTIENGYNNYQVFGVLSDNIKNKSFLNGVRIILKNIKIKDIEVTKDDSSHIKLNNLKVGKKPGFYVIKNLVINELTYLGEDIVVESSSEKTKTEYYEGYTLTSLVKESYDYIEDLVYINYYGIKKTKSGEYYMYSFYKNNIYKGGEIDEEEKKYNITVEFYDKDSEGEFYYSTLSFTFDKEESKVIIDDFIDSIKTSSGQLPFKMGELERGGNFHKKSDF